MFSAVRKFDSLIPVANGNGTGKGLALIKPRDFSEGLNTRRYRILPVDVIGQIAVFVFATIAKCPTPGIYDAGLSSSYLDPFNANYMYLPCSAVPPLYCTKSK